MPRYRSRVLILILLFSGMFSFLSPLTCFSNDESIQKDSLRRWNTANGDIVSLDGIWDFYWEEYHFYEDFSENKSVAGKNYVEVPGYWTDYDIEGEDPTPLGYATFRRKIELPDAKDNKFGLRVPLFDDSYRLYVDSILISSSGYPAENAADSRPGYNPGTAFFESDSDSVDIIVHVANFNHRRGGFWQSMMLGPERAIIKQQYIYGLVSDISSGVLFAFSLFFLSFFLLYRKNTLSLFFAIALFGILLRLISTDTYPILIFNPSWDWIIRLEYIGSFIALTGGMWYFLTLFKSDYLKKITTLFTVVNGLAILVILFSEVRVFAYTMFYFQPISLVMLLFYTAKGFLGALKGNRDHILFFVALFVFMLGLINDVLIANSIGALSGNYIIHFTVQFFVFIQAISIIRKWVLAYEKTEELNHEIEYINLNLEKLVTERTNALNNRNDEVRRQSKEIRQKNKELEKGVEFHEHLLSIIAHDLKSPVSSVYQVVDYLYKTREDPDLKDAFRSIRDQSENSLRLIENLLYWGRSMGSELKVTKREILLETTLTDLKNFFDIAVRHKQIRIQMMVRKNIQCWADENILLIILRNLVSNAIKFTPVGGEIILSADSVKGSDKTVFAVQDSGDGMKEDKIKLLKQGKFPDSGYGTSGEKGSGLGLSLCFNLVKEMEGEIDIIPEPGKGTTVKVFLPCQEK